MTTIAAARRAFAASIRAAAGVRSARLVEALAEIPRERFLDPGPWTIVGAGGATHTPTDDPVYVYANASVAIDAARMIYNGQPGLIASWLDALALEPGGRVVHIGCGAGYYSALLAHLVGSTGAVQAIDVDPVMADRARANLADWPWVRAGIGDGVSGLLTGANAVLVHAGASHVLRPWMDALADGGRLIVPLTASLAGMPDPISKGMVLTARRNGARWSARVGSFVAIYSLVGLRDERMSAQLGQAMMAGTWKDVTSLRTDAHAPDATCWLHGDVCLSTAERANAPHMLDSQRDEPPASGRSAPRSTMRE